MEWMADHDLTWSAIRWVRPAPRPARSVSNNIAGCPPRRHFGSSATRGSGASGSRTGALHRAAWAFLASRSTRSSRRYCTAHRIRRPAGPATHR